jgi:LytS/YehU family sensor histidine kinase
MRLTSLLRGVLRSDGEFTTLGRELDLIEAYLDIESARFEERLRIAIRVPDHLRSLRLPALLLQPLVENAIKHGIAPERHGGDLLIEARVEGRTADASHADLVLIVRDSGAGSTELELRHGRSTGVGLQNVERRLAVQYGAAADLSIRTTRGVGTTAVLRIPAEVGEREIAMARGSH